MRFFDRINKNCGGERRDAKINDALGQTSRLAKAYEDAANKFSDRKKEE